MLKKTTSCGFFSKNILNHYCDLELTPKTVSNLFKFQAQNSDLEYIIFFKIWRFEKRISLSEKEPPLKFRWFFGSSEHKNSEINWPLL